MGIKGYIKGNVTAATLGLSVVLSGAALAQDGYEYVNRYEGAHVVDQHQFKHPYLASDSTASVGTALVLAMDTSDSMSAEEFEIQLRATADAINSELFRSAIKYKSGNPSVAIAAIDFDEIAMLRVPWVDIRGAEINDRPYKPDDPENSSSFPDVLDKLAEEIINLPRRGNGGTSFGPPMKLSYNLFVNAPWAVAANGKRVLDFFSDGRNWYFTDEKRNLASLGVTINAFAIMNEIPDLDVFFMYGDPDFRGAGTLVTKGFTRSADGIVSEPGRVWGVARNLRAKDNEVAELRAFFGDVATAMKQKVTVEVAGLENYHKTLALLGQKPVIPVPVID